MTTIVYKDGILAADGQCHINGIVVGTVKKVFRVKKFLIGICGSAHSIPSFLCWFEAGCPEQSRMELDSDSGFGALVIDPTGRDVKIFNRLWLGEKIDSDFHAIGSGYELALGAMALGAEAVQAVRVACQLDIYSGFPIDAVSINGMEWRVEI